MSGNAKSVLVAPRAPKVGAPGGCRICQFAPSLVARINAAIWPEGGLPRATDYAKAGARVCAEDGINDIGYRSFAGHAEHIEHSWRLADSATRSTGRERPVFATDFVSVTDKAAALGMAAMEALEGQIDSGLVEARDLIGAARMGVAAVDARQKSQDRQRGTTLIAEAIFGVVSGHLSEPEGEVRNVTPVYELVDELTEQRRLLTARAGNIEDDLAEALA